MNVVSSFFFSLVYRGIRSKSIYNANPNNKVREDLISTVTSANIVTFSFFDQVLQDVLRVAYDLAL